MARVPCPHCSRQFSPAGINYHLWAKHGEGVGKVGGHKPWLQRKVIAWNKGLSSASDERVSAYGDAVSLATKGKPGRLHTDEAKAKMSATAKRNKNGGYKPGSGRGKHGWYQGFWCDSTWELAFVIWALGHDIPLERNWKQFPYTKPDGTPSYYVPDFFRKDTNSYIEIKGRILDVAIHALKLAAVPEGVEVVGKDRIGPILAYAKAQVGTDLTKVYELKNNTTAS